MGFAAIPIADLPDGQLRNKWRMPRQNAKIPVLPGNLHLLGPVLDDELFGSHDFELERFSHQSSVSSRQLPLAIGHLSGDGRLETVDCSSTLPPSASPRPRALHQWCPSYKKPAPGYRRTCLRQYP